MPDVRCERKGQALWLKIDREERRNALNEAVFDGLRAGLAEAEATPDIRAVVITGAGEKAFCAGGDLKPNAEGDPFSVDPAERDNPAVKLFRAIVDCRVPVIARVNGHALAGGFGLVCACDFAIVADHARLGVPEARIGIFPMMILPFMLRTIPRRKLLELCVTGEPISAADALAHGMVNYVVPRAALDDKVAALVAAIAASSPTAIGIGRRALATIDGLSLEAGLEYAQRLLPQLARTQDAREGFRAFNEKRAPGLDRAVSGMARDMVRIGCASAFWGDSNAGAEQLVRRGDIDFLVFDYLAEITMSLLARARARKPELGYVPDFVDAIAPLLREIKEKRIRLVSNAGGINPHAAAAALRRKADEAGVVLDIAVVTGDDLSDRAEEIRAAGVTEMFSGAVLPEKLTTMNAYLGAQPIALALDRGADVVITGRCVDSAVVLGPLVHALGWSWSDYDKLAQGSLAGHLLECAAQVTGGLFTDWRDVPGWDDMGMPIAACSADGSFVITKPPGTGGLVSPLSVGEQMLYEIGDPGAYILPDVVCDFRDVRMTACGPDEVRVAGARGRPPTPTLKVSATWHDGYRVIGTLTIGGYEAAAKAERAGEAILARVRRLLTARGIPYFSETSIEVLGAESMYGPWRQPSARNSREVVLKIGARHREQDALDVLAREIFPPGSSMAQGITGFFAGRPSVQPVLRLFSFLWPKEKVVPVVHVGGAEIGVPFAASQPLSPPLAIPAPQRAIGIADAKVPLIALAVGRSGDKGNSANIGLIARRSEYLPWLRAALMEDAVRDWFAHNGVSKVERFDLPGIHALNFLLHDALGGGGVASLRVDAQGKAFAQMLMDYPIPVPLALAQSLTGAAGVRQSAKTAAPT